MIFEKILLFQKNNRNFACEINSYTTMAQEKLNALLQVLIISLPIQEQEWLVREIQENIRIEKQHPTSLNEKPYTWDELRARVQESLDQYHRGEYYSDEEDDALFDEFLRDELKVAV